MGFWCSGSQIQVGPGNYSYNVDLIFGFCKRELVQPLSYASSYVENAWKQDQRASARQVSLHKGVSFCMKNKIRGQ